MIRTRYSRSGLKLRFDPVSRMCLAAVEEGATPGLVVLVAAQGQTLFHEAFGARQLVPRRLPALPDTMYDVASLTKAVATSVLAMQEIGGGRLTLDTKVATLLSELSARTGADNGRAGESGPEHDSEAGASEHGVSQLARDDITVRQLLSHSSGLPAHRPFWKQAAHSPAERLAIARLAAREPLAYPPGTRAVYSDLGFILLGWLLERLTAARLDVLFQDRIARPLGLAATTFVNLADSEARARLLGDRTVAATQLSAERHGLVLGEVDDLNAFAMGGIAGHAGLFSTAGDLAAIATALVASFRGQGHRKRRPGRARRHPSVLVTVGRPGVDLAARLGRPRRVGIAGGREAVARRGRAPRLHRMLALDRSPAGGRHGSALEPGPSGRPDGRSVSAVSACSARRRALRPRL